MYIAVYVNDLLIVGPSIAEIKKIKRKLANRFQMTDLGPCSYYLEMSVQRDRQNRKLYLSQEAYIDKVAHQFGINNAAPVNISMETSPLPRTIQDTAVLLIIETHTSALSDLSCTLCLGKEGTSHTPSL